METNRIYGDNAANIANGGYIMQMQNFSVNDGEGIRTTIFLSGCPLHCKWCSNPEGQTLENGMTRFVTAEEVVSHISRQMPFYRHSGGGVTFSGGEATLQEQFLRKLTNTLYDMGIHLALETCGYFDFERVKDILNKMELIFFDIKHMSEKEHSELTGKSIKPILENSKRVASLNKEMVVRIPLIRDVNGTEENIRQTISFMKENIPEAKLEFLPYHTFGADKYKKLKREPPSSRYEAPSEEQIRAWKEMACLYDIEVVSYR